MYGDNDNKPENHWIKVKAINEKANSKGESYWIIDGDNGKAYTTKKPDIQSELQRFIGSTDKTGIAVFPPQAGRKFWTIAYVLKREAEDKAAYPKTAPKHYEEKPASRPESAHQAATAGLTEAQVRTIVKDELAKFLLGLADAVTSGLQE